MDDICSILLHLSGSIFNISARAPTAGSKSYEFNFLSFIKGESSFTIAHGS